MNALYKWVLFSLFYCVIILHSQEQQSSGNNAASSNSSRNIFLTGGIVLEVRGEFVILTVNGQEQFKWPIEEAGEMSPPLVLIKKGDESVSVINADDEWNWKKEQ